MTGSAEPPDVVPPVNVPPVIPGSGADPALRDRGGFLTFLGIVEIVLGALLALFGLLMVLAVAMTRPAGMAEWPSQGMALSVNVIFYLGAAVFLIVMGIGTMRVRRWARILMLTVSWSLFVSFIFGLVMVTALVPGILARIDTGPADPAIVRVLAGILIALAIGMMLGLPLFFILAYSGRHVKHTFAVRHPEPGWVDRCPTSVLALSLVMVLFGLAQMAGAWTGLSVLFGVAMQGPAAVAVSLGLGLGWVALAIGLFRLSRTAWLLSLAYAALIHVSTFMFYRRMSLLEVSYRLGMGGGEAAALQAVAPFVERWTGVIALLSGVAWILALLAVRRHFGGGARS